MQNPIKDALLRRGRDLARVMTGEEASLAINELMKEAGCSPDEMREFWATPEESLGPFAGLHVDVKKGLGESALFNFLEWHSLSSPILDRAVHGTRTHLGYRLIKVGWTLIHRLHFRGGAQVVRLGRKLVGLSRARGKKLLSKYRFTDRYHMPLAYALWVHCGCDVLGLIQDYIEDIPVDRRFCPVWRSEGRRSESCMIVGIDTLMHEGKVCFVESNMNPGFHADRRDLYPEGDPVCRNIVKYAAENDFSRIVIFPANVVASFVTTSYLMEVELEESWQAIAAEKGIELEVFDSPVLGSPYNRQSDFFMSEDTRDTLFVNIRALNSPISRLLGTKGKLEAHLLVCNEELDEMDQVLVPRMIADDNELPPPDRAPRFPNIIVKDTTLDRAEGIVMYKCSTLPEGANEGASQAFEYVVPDRESRDVNGSTEEFVFVFRSHILLTSNGPRYLAVRKDLSAEPVPPALEEGRVQNMRGYISNLHLGSYSVQTSDNESSAHERFAMAVGTPLCNLLRKKHGTPIQ
ncbi:MAG: hypothetical protein KAH56_02155 [Candidatus Krumholzibacteria bacterium]|nr:hypothetical protein [Candidatus Krumholzibacteria bacterium]